MKSVGRVRAVADAAQVFCWTLAVVGIVHWMLAAWQRRITVWPVAEYLTMLAVPLLWLYCTDADLRDYGVHWAGIRQQLDAAVRCGIPFSAFALLSFINWGGFSALISMAAGIAALFLFGYVLQKRSASSMAMAPCVLVALSIHGASSAATGVVFYLLLLGPGEEVLFRGVIQSRLNLAFGRPFEFSGARWGWGALIASLLFGAMHVLNLPALFEGHWHPNWWAGPVTFCLALPFAYLRERTGGVIAPAMLHAFPQAIAFAIRSMAWT
jgi:membrane protease YdiL (CAAX protease family)